MSHAMTLKPIGDQHEISFDYPNLTLTAILEVSKYNFFTFFQTIDINSTKILLEDLTKKKLFADLKIKWGPTCNFPWSYNLTLKTISEMLTHNFGNFSKKKNRRRNTFYKNGAQRVSRF